MQCWRRDQADNVGRTKPASAVLQSICTRTLILELRDGLGATIVIVSHELASLFAICDDGVSLDAETQTAY